jgi:hypothetical protein
MVVERARIHQARKCLAEIAIGGKPKKTGKGRVAYLRQSDSIQSKHVPEHPEKLGVSMGVPTSGDQPK